MKKHHMNIISSPLYRDVLIRRSFVTIIHGFHLRHPSYGPTVRTVFRWLSGHLFDFQLHPELVELLVAAVYCGSDGLPYASPTHHLNGFLRFLLLLTSWDWSEVPLIVDFDMDMKPTDHQRINQIYEETKAIEKDSPRALFVAHSRDSDSLWTLDSPKPFIFHQLVTFAKQTYKLVVQKFLGLSYDHVIPSKRWDFILQTDMDVYDVVITLKASVLPDCPVEQRGTSKKLDSRLWFKMDKARKRFKNSSGGVISGVGLGFHEILVDFDPVQIYVKLLHERFDHVATFFYGKHGNKIGVIWNPTSFFLSKTYNLQTSVGLMPVTMERVEKENTKKSVVGFIPNIFSLLMEFETLGEGIVDKIETRR
eukprot:TRINITY_DN12101_c0_g1_i5.p1 TRINITY_DN12101_c0_g1~~TRINITY_DN12101_c0_g1_i5.p1  ORF type:complete len:365 (-),score=83.69 TRINITY_DN12101_c0_g1_i5:297-1391(-)